MKAFITRTEDLKYNIATGIEWFSSNYSLKSAKEGLNKDKLASICVKNFKDEVQYGLCTLIGSKGKKTYSVAALYAGLQANSSVYLPESKVASSKDWIIVEKLEQGYWVGFISNGLVMAETSGNLDLSTAQIAATTYGDTAIGDNLDPVYIGSGMADINQASDINLGLIFNSFKKDEIKKAEIKLSQTSNIVASSIIVAGLGVFVYQAGNYLDWFTNTNEADLIKQQQASEITVAKNYYRDKLVLPDLKSSVKAFYNVIDSKELLMAPWPISSASCQTRSKNCIFTYENIKNVPAADIKKYLSDKCKSVDINIQGTVASCSTDLLIEGQNNIVPGKNKIDITETLQLYDSIGFKTSIGDPVRKSIPGAQNVPTEYIHGEGPWQVEANLVDIHDVSLTKSLPHWAKVVSVTIVESYPFTKIKLDGIYVLK